MINNNIHSDFDYYLIQVDFDAVHDEQRREYHRLRNDPGSPVRAADDT